MDNFCRYADGKKLDRYNEIVPFLNIGWYEVGERHPFFHSERSAYYPHQLTYSWHQD